MTNAECDLLQPVRPMDQGRLRTEPLVREAPRTRPPAPRTRYHAGIRLLVLLAAAILPWSLIVLVWRAIF